MPAASHSTAATPVTSNILRGDYAGSAACRPCHEDVYRQWASAPMHNMTRLPSAAAIHAPFDGRRFAFKADAVRLETRGDERVVHIESHTGRTRSYRVTRVIGGHHREDFAGVEITPGARRPDEERILPISYLLGTGSFRYKGYSVMSPERPELRPGGPWATTCIFCHNTEPYLSDIFGALAIPGTPPYQGEVVDALLPPERRAHFVITDEAALRGAIHDELAFLGANSNLDGKSIEDALGAAVKATRNRFDGQKLVEVGIGCESCHGGCKQHVDDPRRRPSFTPTASFLRVDEHKLPSTSSAETINRACARCHQVLFSRYPWTWEGGRRSDGVAGGVAGGANINSGEGRDLLLGHCAGAMSCVACHDPHAPDNRDKMRALDGPAGDRVCQRCHDRYREPAAIAAHTHHSPTGEGSRCMSCHMPRKNMSLEIALGRYHRIGSPTDGAKVEGDRPLECALCHAGKSVAALVDDMERWWGKRYDREKLRALYGPDLALDALVATLDRGKPHEQATAAMVLGAARAKSAVPSLVRQLANPIPLVRCYVLAALEAIAGAPSGIELHREVAAILDDARRWLATRGIPVDAAQAQVAPAQAGDDGTED